MEARCAFMDCEGVILREAGTISDTAAAAAAGACADAFSRRRGEAVRAGAGGLELPRRDEELFAELGVEIDPKACCCGMPGT